MIQRLWQLGRYIRHGWQWFILIQILSLLGISLACWQSISNGLDSRLENIVLSTQDYYRRAAGELHSLGREIAPHRCDKDAQYRLTQAAVRSNAFDYLAYLSNEVGYCRAANNPLSPLFIGELIDSQTGPIWIGSDDRALVPHQVFIAQVAPGTYLIGVAKTVHLLERLFSYHYQRLQAQLSLYVDNRLLYRENSINGRPLLSLRRQLSIGNVRADINYVPQPLHSLWMEWFIYGVPLMLLLGMSMPAMLVYRRSHKGVFLDDLDIAYRRNEIFPVLQPIVDASSNQPLGYELMARWQHPTMGPITPDTFIPMMERFGRLDQLLQELASQVQRQIPDDRYLSINLSANQLTHSLRDPVSFILGLATRLGITPQQLMIEITEREALDYDNPGLLTTLTELKQAGVKLAFDDFGTGHNGIACLKLFAPDYIKIDKSYVHTIHSDAIQGPVLDSIIQLANTMGIGIIAEGVETEQQRAFLLSRNVTCQQGYLFGKPRRC
ncbi:EAL domain, c-di-GMP-specific phosphodiesterase class I (or its enzymatically inactive variant) [Ferrimonas sediminum]|uniref:EAL domain, c-di-GMP-specific phosphodiesterase class I (Or its enzymatically inactive variant) n=1 Tax=Ferrimonas sediminum TaxID=718193 RepID=A0A1G8NZH4_9GAMM|nr:EAL domain-containing protein [Ferrimonas sediminum]SDI85643.1 EAL domain, c-di-GMP-specific phosphodiesterase class I (or its enzymatically inactive variant) [Ferrimonas sediminum]